MVQIKSDTIKVLYVLLLVSIKCILVESESIKLNHTIVTFVHFEKLKNDFFLTNPMNISSENNVHCFTELNAIKNGIKNSEKWAAEVVDAWGKIPSGILSGNYYDLGEFPQCFNIRRNGDLYKTQYCIGKLVLDQQQHSKPSAYFPLPEFEATFVAFGMCLPAACPLNLLEPNFKELVRLTGSNMSVTLPKESCQFEETPSEIKTIDKFAIGLLGVILCLVLTSTSYDIFCTIYNRKKTRAMLVFSSYSNAITLFSYERSKSANTMGCLHGIRAISSQWIVFLHTALSYMMQAIRNVNVLHQYFPEYLTMIIPSAVYAVDTFFVISGLLASIHLLNELEKSGKINVLRFYVHRYLRLTPLLAVVILFTVSLFRFLGNGPFWFSTPSIVGGSCEQYWWSALLHIQNYVNPHAICLLHTWSISVDMQLYLVAPLIVYSIHRLRFKAMFVWIFMVLVGIIITVAVHVIFAVKDVRDAREPEIAYFPTHIRYTSFLIGLIAGFFFFEARLRTVNIPKKLNLFAWALSLAVMLTVIFASYPLWQLDSKSTPLEYGLYDGLSRVAWSIAVCYIIFACIHNYGGPVNWFLSHPLWQPFSRLSFSIYLLHFPVILLTMASIKTVPNLNKLSLFHNFLANYMLTIFVSIIATLAIEMPIMKIDELLFQTANTPTIGKEMIEAPQNESHSNLAGIKVSVNLKSESIKL